MTMTTTSTVLDNDGDTVETTMTTASKATQRADYEVRCDYSGVVYIVQLSAIYVVCSLFYAVQYALFGRLLTAVQSLDVARNRSDEQHDYTPNETANHAAER